MSADLSVIIPYYRARKTIKQALDSVFGQSFTNLEVLLVDDASGDDLAEMVAGYQAAKRGCSIEIRLLQSEVNLGPAAARNLAWDHAGGNYVAFLDADDEWHPQKLEICLQFMNRTGALGVGHVACVSADGEKLMSQRFASGDFLPRNFSRLQWLLRNRAATPAIVLKNIPDLRFDSNLRYCEDHDLWVRLAFQHAPISFLEGPPLTRLSRPSLTPGGHSSRVHSMRWGETKMYIKLAYTHPRLLPILPLLVGFSMAKHLYLLARLSWRTLRG